MISYELAKALQDAGFRQDVTRQHINEHGTVFYTRKSTNCPVCPSADELMNALFERYWQVMKVTKRLAGEDLAQERFAKLFANYKFWNE